MMRRDRAFRSLWSARAVSVTGDSLSLVALMLFIAEGTGEALAVAVLLLVGDFAPSLLSPVTGAISDRFDLKRIMISCELAQGSLLVLIAITLPPLPVLLALVAARAIAGQIFLPASRTAVPSLVPDRELSKANASLGFATNGAEVAGPLIAAALFPFLGIRGVLLIDAVSFLAAAAILTALPSLPRRSGDGDRPSLFGEAKLGLGYLATTPVVRVIAAGFFAVVAFNGIDDVALTFLATDTFGAGGSAFALLLAAVGLGLLAGYALLARYGARLSLTMLLLAGFAVNSAGNLLTGLAWAVAAAFAMQAMRGFGIAAMDVATNTMLQRLVPAGMQGRVFGNLYGAIGVAAALSYVLGGVLLDVTSAPVTFLVAGSGGLLATAAVTLCLTRARGFSLLP